MSKQIIIHPVLFDKEFKQVKSTPTAPSLTLMGMPVIISENAVVEEETMRERYWRERLFTLPWHPLKRYEIKSEWVPGMFIINAPDLSLSSVIKF